MKETFSTWYIKLSPETNFNEPELAANEDFVGRGTEQTTLQTSIWVIRICWFFHKHCPIDEEEEDPSVRKNVEGNPKKLLRKVKGYVV